MEKLEEVFAAGRAESRCEIGNALSRLFQLRKIHTDRIADMAIENFIEMRDKVGNPRFLMEKAVEKILQEEFPKQYVSRYSLVTFSRVPYNLAYEVGKIGNEILRELCCDIKDPQEVDLKKAEELIRQKMTPVLYP